MIWFMRIEIENKFRAWLPLGILIFLANAITYLYVNSEQTIYYFDYSVYPIKSVGLSHEFSKGLLSSLGVIFDSINKDEYNLFAAVPIAIALKIFGSSRVTFELAVVNFWALPSFLMICQVSKKLVRCLFGDEKNRLQMLAAIPWLTFLIGVGFSFVWGPVFRGYISIGGTVFGLLALSIFIDAKMNKMSLSRALLMGLCFCLMTIHRRWYAFWVVIFIIFMAMDWVHQRIRSPKALLTEDLRNLFDIDRHLGFILVVFCCYMGLLILLTPDSIRQWMTSDYRHLYSAYSTHKTLESHFDAWLYYFGTLGFVLIFFAAAALVLEPRTRLATLVGVLHGILVYFFHTRIQDMHLHQTSLLFPLIGLLVVVFGSYIYAGTNQVSKWSRAIFLPIGITWVSLAPVAFLSDPPQVWEDLRHELRGLRLPPLQRSDMAELSRLSAYLELLLSRSPDDKYAVVSSSLELNQSTTDGANLENEFISPLVNRRIGCPDVDVRDGFPRCVYEARFIVMAEPLQIHINLESQRVVAAPTESLMSGTNIGRAFRRLPETFNLEKNVKVVIFEKIRELTAEEMSQFEDGLKKYYPNEPFVYAYGGKK